MSYFLCRLPFSTSKQFCSILPHLILSNSIFPNLSSKWYWNLFIRFLDLRPSPSASVLLLLRRQEEESYGISIAICYSSDDDFTVLCTNPKLMDGVLVYICVFNLAPLSFNGNTDMYVHMHRSLLYQSHATVYIKAQ